MPTPGLPFEANRHPPGPQHQIPLATSPPPQKMASSYTGRELGLLKASCPSHTLLPVGDSSKAQMGPPFLTTSTPPTVLAPPLLRHILQALGTGKALRQLPGGSADTKSQSCQRGAPKTLLLPDPRVYPPQPYWGAGLPAAPPPFSLQLSPGLRLAPPPRCPSQPCSSSKPRLPPSLMNCAIRFVIPTTT